MPVSLTTGTQTVEADTGQRLNLLACSYTPQRPAADGSSFHLTYGSLGADEWSGSPTLIEQPDPGSVSSRDASDLADGASSTWQATAESSQCITSVPLPSAPGVSVDVVFTVTPKGDPSIDCEITEGYFRLDPG